MRRRPTQQHLRQDIVQAAIDEFTSLIGLEGVLLAHFHRAHQDEGRGQLPYVEGLQWHAKACRERRQHLMENFAIPEEQVRKSRRIIRRWELAIGAVAAQEQEEGELEEKKMDIVSDDVVPAEPVRGARWWTWVSTWSWLTKVLRVVGLLFLLITALALLAQCFRLPVPLTLSTKAINLSTRPRNMTARIATRLASAEKQLASCVSAMETFPHALEACLSAQTHVGKVRELWVEGGIFDEALALDLRTTAKLVEIASEDTWTPWLDLAAYYCILPAAWTKGCVAVRMAKILEAHAGEEAAWKMRMAQAVMKGRRHVAAAQQQVLHAQTVWLPIEAKKVVTAQVRRVSKAWHETVMLCGRLGVSQLGSVWTDTGVGGEEQEEEQESGEDVSMCKKKTMHHELLSHGTDSLRRWAEELKAVAECRLDEACWGI